MRKGTIGERLSCENVEKQLFLQTLRLLTPLAHLRFDFDKNALQNLKTGNGRVADHAVFGSIMEMMWKSVYSRVVGSVIPSLDQMAIGILPMVTVPGDLKNTLGLQNTLGQFYKATVRESYAIAVIQHFFRVCIPDGSSNNRHIIYG